MSKVATATTATKSTAATKVAASASSSTASAAKTAVTAAVTAPVSTPVPAKAVSAPAAAAVVVEQKDAASTAGKKSAKRKADEVATTTAAPVAAAATTSTTSVTTGASEASASAETSAPAGDEITTESYLAKIDAIEKHIKLQTEESLKAMKELKTEFKNYVKQSTKKNAQQLKDARIAKRRRTQPQESGITRPRKITGELAAFLAVPTDSMLSLTAVSGKVCKYIKDLNLQNPADRRQIFCDDKLKALLKPDNATISYPILQRLLTQHLIKEEVVAAASTSSA